MENKRTEKDFVVDCGGIQMPKAEQAFNTEIVFILDASGSMHGLESDTVGGVNCILEEQKKVQNGGTMYVSTVIFNTVSTVVHDRVEIAKVEPMSVEKYTVGGCTALYDAVGDAIRHISNIHKYARKEDVPQKTLFVIMTDGMENASRRYGLSEVKRMIAQRQEKYGWEFMFLAANIDAGAAAENLGISRERAVDWNADGDGVQVLYECTNAYIDNARRGKKYSRALFDGVDRDYQDRKKKNKTEDK